MTANERAHKYKGKREREEYIKIEEKQRINIYKWNKKRKGGRR